MITAAFTGHRLNKFHPTENLAARLAELVLSYEVGTVYNGLAVGFDQWAAWQSVHMGLKVIGCAPFKGQHLKWPPRGQQDYRDLLFTIKAAGGTNHIICEGPYAPEKMQIRNQYMVDHADLVIAYFDGSPGGTANCVRYAKSKGKPVINLLG
jgi:uncharacterized phage-like protein YoqJ